ncbi:MAG: PIN domain-containing protein [Nitrospirae bacterium]|nr:PIN domain-containing protein [Nitrospirota bacterium]
MKYLADTVTIIRHFAKTGKIGRKAKGILDDAEVGKHHIFISVISLVEIMYLSQKMRIKINLKETLKIINSSANYSIVDLTPQIVMIAEETGFPELFDRLILATARHLGVPMLTPDEDLQKTAGVKIIWQ